VTTILLNAVFNPPFEIVHRSGHQLLIRSPRRSAPRHASELGLSRESVRTILQTDLRFHPYKMQVFQQLNVRDYAQRVDFPVRMHVSLEENENAIIIMSDEAHFH
jgi:hypothetical protein